jgi:hypothetical protein
VKMFYKSRLLFFALLLIARCVSFLFFVSTFFLLSNSS